jgi:hypothetical protein
MDYVNFDLLVERAEPGYRVKVISEQGEERSDLAPLPEDLSVERFLQGIGRSNRAATRDLHPVESVPADIERTTIRFGTQLFETLFPTPIKRMLDRNVGASGQDKGLRLRLHLTHVPELAILPWEFLYDSVWKFFALNPKISLVRYLELPQPVGSPMVTPPFKILVAIACPARYVQIDAEREWQDLKGALTELEARRLVEVQLLEDATTTRLKDRLCKEDFHIFHFIGHGDFDGKEGFLAMEDDTKLTMKHLGALLSEERRTLRLVILNACKGARASPGDPFNGLAQTLIQEQIPAVIAMQFAISDPAAITFARDFYGALAEGKPVDESLRWARKGILLGSNLEWGTPVLFLRSGPGQIFTIEEKPPRVSEGVILPPDEAKEERGTLLRARPEPEYVTYFVDREQQCDFFLKMIDGKTPKQVMEVEALAGMGKTFLIGRLLYECRKQGLPVARIDFSDYKWDHIDIFSKVRSLLGKDHFPHMTQLMDKHKNLYDEARASQSLEHRLMEAFFEDLRNLCRYRVIVLLFDSYDKSPSLGTARKWLRCNLLPDIRDGRLPNIVVVLAGREVPVRPPGLPVEFFYTDLACFDDSHMKDYLEKKKASLSSQLQSSKDCLEGKYRPGELAAMADLAKEEYR